MSSAFMHGKTMLYSPFLSVIQVFRWNLLVVLPLTCCTALERFHECASPVSSSTPKFLSTSDYSIHSASSTLHRLRGFWGTALAFRNLYFATHPPFGANYVRLRLPDIPPCLHRARASARKACTFEINSIVGRSRQCVTQVGGIVRNYSFNSCCLESPRDVYAVQMD
ncbi:hypothetical protein EI94DRAFT_912968 [Lactarius quietus]|nr:hypothetical protein EI94DRAFT_912968 [Lactarius quietus]